MKTWDLPTRIYHWLQALIFMVLALSGFELFGSEQLHERFGAALAVLVFWRLGWGVIGSDTSRFVNFTPSASKILAYVRGNAKQSVGHNPLGALMVLSMLILLLFQIISGVVISEFIDGKSLFERQTLKMLKSIHEINAWALIICSCFHVLAILVYKLKGKPLLMAMITGSTNNVSSARPELASKRRAAMLLMMTILFMILTINLLK